MKRAQLVWISGLVVITSCSDDTRTAMSGPDKGSLSHVESSKRFSAVLRAWSHPIGGPQAAPPPAGRPNTMDNHGGRVLTSPKVYAVYWGPSVIYASGPQPGTLGSGAADNSVIGYFLSNLGTSPYWAINSYYYQSFYGEHVGNLVYSGYWADNNALRFNQGSSVISVDSVEFELARGIQTGTLAYDQNTIYTVFAGPTVDLGDILSRAGGCAEHRQFQLGGYGSVVYAMIPHPQVYEGRAGCYASLLASSTSPNGDIWADRAATLIAHELEESATDPDIGTWYHSDPFKENADICVWEMPGSSLVNGAYSNMKIGVKHFLVQSNFLLATQHCHLGGATGFSINHTSGTATLGVPGNGGGDTFGSSVSCNASVIACPVLWESSNPSVATVPASTTGAQVTVTPVALGSATITGCTTLEDTETCLTHVTTVYNTFTTTISGPSRVRLNQTCLWTASTGGGTAPFNYGTWTAPGAVGSSETPDSWTGYMPSAGGDGFDIWLYVWDAQGVTSLATKHVTISATAPNCTN